MNIEHHLPAQNFYSAIAILNQETETIDEYKRRIHELTGEEIESTDLKEVKYTYLYFLQNAKTKDQIDLNLAHRDAKKFVERFEWSFDEENEQSDVKVDKKTGEVRKKKGWKKAEAVKIYQNMTENETRHDIIQKFMDQLDMTKQGATTYWYIAKAEAEKSG